MPHTSPTGVTVFERFATRTISHAEWDHEAHLTVCWFAVREHGRVGALAHLRNEIADFNGSIGIENTPTSGYHETLTRYFVDAVAAADVADPSDLFELASCRRDAPLHRWSRAILFSAAARAAWVEPDLDQSIVASMS